MAWNLVTKEFALPKDKLLVTVYHTDDEAADLWKKIGLGDDKIIRIPTNDNFWAMETPVPAVLVLKSFLIMVIISGAALQAHLRKMETGSLRFPELGFHAVRRGHPWR